MTASAFLSKDNYDKLDGSQQADYILIEAEAAEKLTGDKTLVHQLDVGEVAGFTLENAKGLRKALGEERATVSTLRTELGVFEGFDVAAAKADRKQVEKMANMTPTEEVEAQIEAKVKSVGEQWKEKYDVATKQADDATSRLADLTVDDAIRAAIKKHSGNMDLLFDKVRATTRPIKNDAGKLIPVIMGPDGKPIMSQRMNEHGHMSLEEHVEGLKKQKTLQAAFDADGGPGTGGKNSEGAGGPAAEAGVHGDAFNISRTDAKDAQKYGAAKDAATKAGKRLQIVEVPTTAP